MTTIDTAAATGISRRDYTEWVRGAAALAQALRYPVQPSMINEGTGIVFGDSQYEAFRRGLWSPEAYEVMIIFEALNEPAVDGLPRGAESFAEYGGLCDKLMILHPGKYCPPHYHPRKTESYEVLMGTMEVFYRPDGVDGPEERLSVAPMPEGSAWPEGVEVPSGRESTYSPLTSFVRLQPGDPKFVMHRNHLHAFRCPPDSPTPLVVREISTYSHEPTEAARDKRVPLDSWRSINDNVFLSDEANTGRLRTEFGS
jgi:D-lyxose ketol-isomerase